MTRKEHLAQIFPYICTNRKRPTSDDEYILRRSVPEKKKQTKHEDGID